MKQNQKNQKIKAKELLTVFQEIDTKIRELHQNSSHVFLRLNSFLKDYYRKNSTVALNATRIFDTIAGDRDSSLASDLNLISEDFSSFKMSLDVEFKSNLKLYNALLNKTDNLSLMIRNFKQDLLTLKFLITNLKIISRTEAPGSGLNKMIRIWEQLIAKVHPGLTEIGKRTEEISITLNSLAANSNVYSKHSLGRNLASYEELKSSVLLINNKNNESINYIPVLKERINRSSESIGNIIKHLQFHDIIRQKVEHIQKSHLTIISALESEYQNSGDIRIDKEDVILPIIADISGLQAAQLILISKEYQKALEVISENFQMIADDLAAVSTISHEFSFDTPNSDSTLFNILKDRLDKSLVVLDEMNSNSSNQALIELKQKISALHHNVEEIVIQPFEKTLASKNISEYLAGQREAINGNSGMILHISSLVGDIILRKEELKRENNSLLKQSGSIQTDLTHEGFRSSLERDQIKIMVNISKILEKLDNESKRLDTVLVENYNIKKEIVDKLKETLAHADYYELFDKVLNIIINQLNDMNSKLRKITGKKDSTGLAENLKDIESYYTVASERIIHQSVLNHENHPLQECMKPEEDVELF